MLAQKLKDLMRLPEPRWDAPRPVDTAYGGGAGSPRVLLFSGLDSGEKSTLVSAMEARGLPRLCVTSHSPGNTNSRLGTVDSSCRLTVGFGSANSSTLGKIDTRGFLATPVLSTSSWNYVAVTLVNGRARQRCERLGGRLPRCTRRWRRWLTRRSKRRWRSC